jgi:drug/metabolite transporter (DMT)-like permease
VKRPPFHILFLALGLVAASQSGNIVRLGEAPGVAIAAWRLVIATLVLAPFAWRQRRELQGLSGRDRALVGLVGLILAAHFVAFIMGVQRTTVANAMLFFAINPLFTALAGWLLYRERVGPRLIGAIALGVGGVAVMGWSDLSMSGDHLLGDGLALLSALLFSAYFSLGKHLRRGLSNTLYVTSIYGVAAVPCLIALPLLGHPVLAYSPRTWLCFVLMAAVPTLLGHSAMNHALRHIDASRVSTATLVEPLLGGLVAFWLWSEELGLATAAGYALIAGSVLVLLSDRAEGPAEGA